MNMLAITENMSNNSQVPYFDKENFENPIIICGCHGGGTSFVTKILRHLGVFVGNDAGSIHLRKFHESHIFRHVNENILHCLIEPKPPRGMMTTQRFYWDRYFASINNSKKVNQIAKSIDLGLIFSHYSPLTLPDKKAVFTQYGWKDPRNSITLPIWRKVFPNSRILVVQSPHKKGPSNSDSGDWFKNKSDEKTRNYYMNPLGIKKNDDCLYFDYQSGVQELKKFNKLVTWLGLSALNQQQLDELLVKVNYEG